MGLREAGIVAHGPCSARIGGRQILKHFPRHRFFRIDRVGCRRRRGSLPSGSQELALARVALRVRSGQLLKILEKDLELVAPTQGIEMFVLFDAFRIPVALLHRLP